MFQVENCVFPKTELSSAFTRDVTPVLFTFSPLCPETNQNAQNYVEFIRETLRPYEKNMGMAICVVTNFSKNKTIESKLRRRL